MSLILLIMNYVNPFSLNIQNIWAYPPMKRVITWNSQFHVTMGLCCVSILRNASPCRMYWSRSILKETSLMAKHGNITKQCVPMFLAFLCKVTCGLVPKIALGVSNYSGKEVH